MPVLLFQRLLTRSVDRDDLPALRTLASLPIPERAPWLGALAPALSHDDVDVRVAAVRALAGARGRVGLLRISESLDDRDQEVRIAAVESLRASSAGLPAAWALAIFHRDPAVRRAAVEGTAPLGCESLALHLLPDPACADRVTLPAQPRAIGPILAHVRTGVMSAERARAWIESNLGVQLLNELLVIRYRTPAEIDPILDGDDPGVALDDTLEEMIELFLAPDVEPSRCASVLRTVRALLLGRPDTHRRAAAALYALLRRRGELPAPACALLGAVYPAALADVRLSRAVRVDALEGPLQCGDAVPALAAETVDALLGGDLVRTPEGTLDLRALAAVFTVARGVDAATVIARLGEREIIEAFRADAHRAAPLIARAPSLLPALLSAMPDRRALLVALAITATPTDDVALPAGVDAALAIDVALALDVLRASEEARLTSAKIGRSVEVLGACIAAVPEALRALMIALVDHDDAKGSPLLLDLLGDVARRVGADAWVDAARSLDLERLVALVTLLGHVTSLPFAKELALAHALAEHEHPALRGWATSRVPRPALEDPTSLTVTTLDEHQVARIAGATTAGDLLDALRPALTAPRRGLVAVLAARRPIVSPVVCAALLASHDDPVAVARELARWSAPTAAFRTELDAEMVRRWRGRQDVLPVLANAWLHLFEAHAFALIERLAAGSDGALGALAAARSLPAPILAQQIWAGVATVAEMWRWRDRARLEELATPALFDLALAELDTDLGDMAARLLVSCGVVAPTLLAERTPAIVARLPDLPERTRERLAPIASARGLAPARRPPRARITSDELDAIDRIKSLADLDALARECEGTIEPLVQEAALALLLRGAAAGERRIAQLLEREPGVPCASALAGAVDFFESQPALDVIEAMVRARRGAGADAELRFRLAVSLARLGRTDLADVALEAACDPTPPIGWMRESDVERLEALRPLVVVACTLARSPHPHAYTRAVRTLRTHVWRPAERERCLEGLRAFLIAGPERHAALRREVAQWLIAEEDRLGAPLLLQSALRAEQPLPIDLIRRISEGMVMALAEGGLTVGHEHVLEPRIVDLLERLRTRPSARESALRRVLEDGIYEVARRRARLLMAPARARDAKLREVADVFAWGTRRARELTGRVLRFHISDVSQLGYTTMRSGDVHVTPLPIFQRERDGRTIVEALVLHEIGHHVFHGSDEAIAIWEKADEMGLVRLLNLVMDEHLERNLRAMEAEWGDRLKTLAAWAFRHSRNDVKLDLLLSILGAHAFDVLSATKLGVARDRAAITVESGAVLGALEARGHSFARFVRALRMGLGDRSGDPKVREALALFDRKFRHADVPRLWEIAQALHRIFGQEIDVALGFGGAESVSRPGELVDCDEGITDGEVQREVQRVLEAPRSTPGAPPAGRDQPLAINVGASQDWAPITRVEVLAPDPGKHEQVASTVRRHADRMRRHLEELGLRWEPQRMRLQGRRLDVARLRALVTRGDPRVLIARELRHRTDLFLGVLIDCSGSMQGTSMERAHAFGVLLAEAARDLRGVDLRAFGFTDRCIYDAGDARRSAITSLRATDGNNDAAALDHVAHVAARSTRRAKLIVMISDGLPTECSVDALRTCVRRTTRRGIACAQVAVRPLEEVCFPHYVVIEGGELDGAVARFGEVITKLVRQVMRG
ncbi:vWA domain-containing protein [Sandaracinus amylolyticus]|uniref:Flagellar hook-length control protein FliK n=1 Tax=Sandaracinus amylolyticus TaxID=927083 RepID=A0A0F6W170_9BACT|nr:vWA domain-containing protein [Sandaracinus amylolyticus]AKF04792.1 Flagellar hook-length control protein FliK [Sandaracinus amylolyticus]